MRLKAFWFITLLLVIGTMIMIFRFSGENAVLSSKKSNSLTEYIVETAERLIPALQIEDSHLKAGFLENFVRKCAHFLEYALLSVCVHFHLLAGELLFQKKCLPLVRGGAGILFCAFYAGTDEFHQYFVPGRACRFYDVGIDTLGAGFGTLLFLTLPTQKVTMWLTMQ